MIARLQAYGQLTTDNYGREDIKVTCNNEVLRQS